MNFWTRLLASIAPKSKATSPAPARPHMHDSTNAQPTEPISLHVKVNETDGHAAQVKAVINAAPEMSTASINDVPTEPTEQGETDASEEASVPPANSDESVVESEEMMEARRAFRQMLIDYPHPGDPIQDTTDNGDEDQNVAGLELSMVTETRRLRCIEEALDQSLIRPLQARMLDDKVAALEREGMALKEIEEQIRFKIERALSITEPTPALTRPVPDDDLVERFAQSKREYEEKQAKEAIGRSRTPEMGM